MRYLLFLIFAVGLLAQPILRITHGPMLGHVGTREISIWARTSQPGPARSASCY